MNARLAEFEGEGQGMFRIPFIQGRQDWASSGGQTGLAGVPENHQVGNQGMLGRAGKDYLGKGEAAMASSEANVMKAAQAAMQNDHVKLFQLPR